MNNFLQNAMGFIILGIILAIVIGLLSILAHVAVIGIAIGLVLYACFWLKNKIFPNNASKNSRFTNYYHFVNSVYNTKGYKSSRSGSNYQHTNSSSNTADNSSEPKHKSQKVNRSSQRHRGRVIDVDPE